MAFVFRSPRNLEQKTQNQVSQLSISFENTSDKPSQINLDKKKHISKGLAYKKLRNKQNKQNNENYFYFGKQNDKISNNFSKKIQQIEKNNKGNKNCGNYFFKSKSNRSYQNINHDQVPKHTINENNQTNQICLKSVSKAKKSEQNILKHKKDFKTEDKITYIQNNKQERYNIGTLPYIINKQIKNSMNLLDSKKKFNSIYAVPSIPGKDEKFGYVVKNNELSYPKNVSKPRFQGEKDDAPGPTDYSLQQNKRVKGVLKFGLSKQKLQHYNMGNQFFALINDQQALNMHNQMLKQWVSGRNQQLKKAQKKQNYYLKRKQREDLQTRDLSEDSNESGITVYVDKQTPGPGYYNSNNKQPKNFRSQKGQFSKIFCSKSQRFQDINSKQEKKKNNLFQDIQKVQEQEQNKSQKRKFFMSKLQRKTNMEIKTFSPPPGHYNVRQSLQNDLISQMIKSPSNVFSNKLPRLSDTVSSISPGPGYYKLNIPNFKIQSFRNQNIYNQESLKKDNTSLLSSYQQSLISIKNEDITKKNMIHSKQDCIIQQQNHPPFLSSSPKGLNLQKKLFYNGEPSLKISKHSQKMKQNFHPFNSSEQNKQHSTTKYLAQVGLYQVNNTYKWQQKSFNILYN